ncbi:MAG TPA: ATP-binding protein, partial [Xanthomonadales bacterium]|nr:ATP-binding protein [Xanthomonadales bacterium]
MKVELRRSFDEIARVVGVTEAYFLSAGVDPNLRTAVDLCIEELFVNMVSYNRETDSNIDLEMNVIEGGIEVSLTD